MSLATNFTNSVTSSGLVGCWHFQVVQSGLIVSQSLVMYVGTFQIDVYQCVNIAWTY